MPTILPPGSAAVRVETAGAREPVGVEVGPKGMIVGPGSGKEHATKTSKMISGNVIALGWIKC